MRKIVLLIVFLLGGFSMMAQELEPEITTDGEALPRTTYYFIRHAEKDRSNPLDDDPHLTQEGLLRSAKWSYVLEAVRFDAIYSTDYNRTRETAMPTAEKNGIDSLIIYDPFEMDMKGFFEDTAGKTILVVGHSNTTPNYVNIILGEEKYPQIDDEDNGHLYIVTILPTGEKIDFLLILD